MKMIYLIMLLAIISCSHHHKEPDHHHHENCKSCLQKPRAAFNKKCAHSVMEGDVHIDGKEEYTLVHEGKKYYFSSQEKMESFKAHLDEHVSRAREAWKMQRGR